MARGVVLRPDDTGCAALRALWTALEDAGVPSVAAHRKGAHEPHLSLTVAAHLEVAEVLAVLSAATVLPSDTITFEAVAAFPQGVLFLSAVPDKRLLDAQRLAYEACAVAPSTRSLWSYYSPGSWLPHVTLGYGLTGAEIGRSMEVLLPALPLVVAGWTAWLEDGDTGESWPLR